MNKKLSSGLATSPSGQIPPELGIWVLAWLMAARLETRLT